MSQLNYLLAVEVPDYDPSKKEYTVLNPVKAIQRLVRGEGWVAEKVVVRHLANGNDEHLHILSRPIPEPPRPVAAEAPKDPVTLTQKVKDLATRARTSKPTK